MRTIACLTLVLIIAPAALATAQDEVEEKLPAPWERPYVGDEATGENVIALWQFDLGDELADSSGKSNSLSLRPLSREDQNTGSRFVEMGKFGSCLECFSSSEKRRCGADAGNAKSLSPEGAFTLEMWFMPKPGFQQEKMMILLDKKYLNYPSNKKRMNDDYMLYIRKNSERSQFQACLGYGDDSADYKSRLVRLEAGNWYHLAFTYDGAGAGFFTLMETLLMEAFTKAEEAFRRALGRWSLATDTRLFTPVFMVLSIKCGY